MVTAAGLVLTVMAGSVAANPPLITSAHAQVSPDQPTLVLNGLNLVATSADPADPGTTGSSVSLLLTTLPVRSAGRCWRRGGRRPRSRRRSRARAATIRCSRPPGGITSTGAPTRNERVAAAVVGSERSEGFGNEVVNFWRLACDIIHWLPALALPGAQPLRLRRQTAAA